MIREQIEAKLRAAFEPRIWKSLMKAIVITFRRAQKAISRWYWSAIALSANVS